MATGKLLRLFSTCFFIYTVRISSKSPFVRADAIVNCKTQLIVNLVFSGSLVDALRMLVLIRTTHLQRENHHPISQIRGRPGAGLCLSFSKHLLGTKYVPGKGNGEGKKLA